MRKRIINLLYSYSFCRWLLPAFHLLIGKSHIDGNRGNTVDTTTANLYHTHIDFHKNNGNSVYVGQHSDLHHSTLIIKGINNTVHIGHNCFINGLHVIIEGNNNTVYIGDHAFILDDTRIYVVDGSSFRMGNGCMFSDRIEIRTTDNHSIYNLHTGDRINPEEDVIIQDRVWIGTGVTILKGTVVADGCIAGAGSVLTRKYTTPNSVLAGNPAKYIKNDVAWTMERRSNLR